ncbi:MAG: hypothetical protein K6C34_01165 [Alphaproteobacteria bacterium]|nr:hypothetical protein [Alphaproteobacteria bacterium]
MTYLLFGIVLGTTVGLCTATNQEENLRGTVDDFPSAEEIKAIADNLSSEERKAFLKLEKLASDIASLPLGALMDAVSNSLLSSKSISQELIEEIDKSYQEHITDLLQQE